MAGDWIPLDVELHNKPKVLNLARMLSIPDDYPERVQDLSLDCPDPVPTITEDEVVGRLTRFWSWAQKHTADGVLHGIAITDLMRAVGYDLRFWEFLCDIGWLTEIPGGFEIPEWDKWMSQSAKARMKAREKKRAQRLKPVPVLSRNCPVKKGTTGEDRREENKETPLPPLPFSSEEFRTTWACWVEHRKEIRKPLRRHGVQMALEKLALMGEPVAIEAMRNSMAGGWQGLFEPKPNGKSNGPAPALKQKRREQYRREEQERLEQAKQAVPLADAAAILRKAREEGRT